MAAEPKKRASRSSKALLTPEAVVTRLRALYGEPEWRPHGDATAELVLTLLSQNTSDHNSGRAFARLLQRFPDWQSIIDSTLDEVIDAIKPGGLAPTKAPRLQAMLGEIKARRGDFDLSFLREMPVDEAREWLRTLPAVGPKTAACVLLFGLGMPGLPVDTHVFRVGCRLGLIEERMGPEKAQTYLEATVPPKDHFGFHILLIRHGRHTCTARAPQCNACPLRPECAYAMALDTGSLPVAQRGKSRRVTSQRIESGQADAASQGMQVPGGPEEGHQGA